MPRPSLTAEHEYPSLDEFARDRRRFLGRLALGALGLGLGGRILGGCYSTASRDSRDLLQVRLPASGMASAYLSEDGYARFAVTLSTYSEAFASHLRANETAGIEVVVAAVAGLNCGHFETGRGVVRRAIADALEEHYLGLADGDGPLVESLDLEVESCQISISEGGIISEPTYP